MWKRACDMADVTAAELRRARQADRDAMDHERAEHDEMLSALVAERDALRSEVEALRGDASETEAQLNTTRDELLQARAALEVT
ncbi:hypothetical protein [Roseovarius salinarum]|uniref:hypothetical protein n=1 Tax=Roseovarius salinarum TaxID=1981892 RepID=UPI000C325E2A|nr:hypothetical protein [Roseovarius salinarum]